MAKREKAAASEASMANLAKGRKVRDEQIAAARAAGAPKAGDRWAMLLDGRLSVRDLDDKEVTKMKVRGRDGGFAGRRRAIPSHLIQQFQSEQLRRFHDRLRKALPITAEVLLEIVQDPNAKASDRLRAAQMLQDRVLGKAPETVRIEGASEWDAMFNDAVDIDRSGFDAEVAKVMEQP